MRHEPLAHVGTLHLNFASCELHERLAIAAQAEGKSLNTLAQEALAQRVAAWRSDAERVMPVCGACASARIQAAHFRYASPKSGPTEEGSSRVTTMSSDRFRPTTVDSPASPLQG